MVCLTGTALVMFGSIPTQKHSRKRISRLARFPLSATSSSSPLVLEQARFLEDYLEKMKEYPLWNGLLSGPRLHLIQSLESVCATTTICMRRTPRQLRQRRLYLSTFSALRNTTHPSFTRICGDLHSNPAPMRTSAMGQQQSFASLPLDRLVPARYRYSVLLSAIVLAADR